MGYLIFLNFFSWERINKIKDTLEQIKIISTQNHITYNKRNFDEKNHKILSEYMDKNLRQFLPEMYNRNKKATIKIKIKINFSKKIND